MGNRIPTMPRGVWSIFFTALLFSISFTCVLIVIEPYTRSRLGFELHHAIELTVMYFALFYTASLLGGYLGSRLEHTKIIIIGGVCTVIGLLAISQRNFLYVGLGCFVVGSGMVHPNLFHSLSHLFRKKHPGREYGFVRVYIGLNLGVVIGIVLATTLPAWLGYSNVFIIAAALNILAIFTFILCQHFWLDTTGPIRSPLMYLLILSGLLLLIIVCVVLASYVFVYLNVSYELIYIVGAIALVVLLHQVWRAKLNKRANMLALFLLILIGLGFWIFFSVSLTLSRFYLTSHIANALHFNWHFPFLNALSLNAMIIVLFGSIVYWFYFRFRRKQPINFVTIIAIGMLFALLGAILIWFFSGSFYTNNGHTSIAWLFITILPTTAAELCIGPMSLAMIGRLSGARSESLLIGTQQVSVGVAWAIVHSLGLPQLLLDFKNGVTLHQTSSYFFTWWILSCLLLLAILWFIVRPIWREVHFEV